VTLAVVDAAKQKSPVAEPLSGTLWGLPATLSVRTRLPLRAAVPLVQAGLKANCTVHVPPGGTLAALQVFPPRTKSTDPLTAIELKARAPVRLLVTVIV
jgi:hypothetical protein